MTGNAEESESAAADDTFFFFLCLHENSKETFAEGLVACLQK